MKYKQIPQKNTYTVSIPQHKNYLLKLYFYTDDQYIHSPYGDMKLEICSETNPNFYLHDYKLVKKDFFNIKQSLHKKIILRHKFAPMYYDIKKILLNNKNINTIKNILIQIHGV